MTNHPNKTTLAQPARAFEVDSSWYQSHWYEQPQPQPRKAVRVPLGLSVWIIALAVGAYFVQ